MATSEQLERDAEETRANISGCLDELRARMTPGRVLDQILDYSAESTGGMFVHNLRQQVVANPLPLTLVGAGLAWLAMASRKSNGVSRQGNISTQVRRASGNMRDTAKTLAEDGARTASEWKKGASERAGEWAQSTKDQMGDWAHQTRGTAQEMSDQAGATFSQIGETVRRGTDALSDAASDAYEGMATRTRDAASGIKDSTRSAMASVSDTASETYAKTTRRGQQAASTASSYASSARRSMTQFFNDQPLVLAGLGIAVGAIIGAALPATDAENELMGDRSDELKDQMGAAAQEQVDKGKSVIKEATHAVQDEVEKQFGVSAKSDGQTDQPTLVPTE